MAEAAGAARGARITAGTAARPGPARIEGAGTPFDLIELFFFAYRDFVSGPDRVLADLGFGRAHHRVLHFVDRNPGLTIAELLDILKITKQSLNRVLKELVEQGYVHVRTGRQDRRQRHLETTPPAASWRRASPPSRAGRSARPWPRSPPARAASSRATSPR